MYFTGVWGGGAGAHGKILDAQRQSTVTEWPSPTDQCTTTASFPTNRRRKCYVLRIHRAREREGETAGKPGRGIVNTKSSIGLGLIVQLQWEIDCSL